MTAPKCPFAGDERKGACDAADITVSVTAGKGALWVGRVQKKSLGKGAV